MTPNPIFDDTAVWLRRLRADLAELEAVETVADLEWLWGELW